MPEYSNTLTSSSGVGVTPPPRPTDTPARPYPIPFTAGVYLVDESDLKWMGSQLYRPAVSDLEQMPSISSGPVYIIVRFGHLRRSQDPAHVLWEMGYDTSDRRNLTRLREIYYDSLDIDNQVLEISANLPSSVYCLTLSSGLDTAYWCFATGDGLALMEEQVRQHDNLAAEIENNLRHDKDAVEDLMKVIRLASLSVENAITHRDPSLLASTFHSSKSPLGDYIGEAIVCAGDRRLAGGILWPDELQNVLDLQPRSISETSIPEIYVNAEGGVSVVVQHDIRTLLGFECRSGEFRAEFYRLWSAQLRQPIVYHLEQDLNSSEDFHPSWPSWRVVSICGLRQDSDGQPKPFMLNGEPSTGPGSSGPQGRLWDICIESEFAR